MFKCVFPLMLFFLMDFQVLLRAAALLICHHVLWFSNSFFLWGSQSLTYFTANFSINFKICFTLSIISSCFIMIVLKVCCLPHCCNHSLCFLFLCPASETVLGRFYISTFCPSGFTSVVKKECHIPNTYFVFQLIVKFGNTDLDQRFFFILK